MFDAAAPPDHQRAQGELRLALRRRGPATVLDDLRQYGCLKARFPRPERGAWSSAVTLNTSGGVAAGDRLDTTITLHAGARATVAAQAAERIYRALPGAAPARLTTRIHLAANAALEWLPQESIFFDRCAVDRRLEIALAPDAWFLGVESLVFGRAAMGEQVHTAAITDTIRLRRNGALVLHDAIRLHGPVAAMLARPAIAAGAACVATILHAAPDAEAALDAARDALVGAEAGASAWNGLLLARILAPDSAALRKPVRKLLEILRAGRPLPRVWLC
jgi:urease accessory protein